MFKKYLTRLLLGVSLLGASSCAIYTAGATQAYVAQESRARIAVLDFEQEGVLAGEKLGGFAADELTAALFAQKKFAVVDRVQVKSGLHALQLSAAVMSVAEIRKLGEFLHADYLVFGKLHALHRTGLDPKRNDNLPLQISFRLIDAREGEMLGVFSARGKSKGELEAFISRMLNKQASAVQLK